MIEDRILVFKKYIIFAMVVALALALIALTASLIWFMVDFIIDHDFILVDKQDILKFLGYFLLIIIGIELMDTLVIYIKKHVVRVEIVILVAITAAARELIVQDYEKVDPLLLIGIGGILVSSAITYYLVRRARIETHNVGLRDEIE